ncbi:MAG: hypothetical protein ACRDH7_14630 [Actinomycetota bacterium]
MRKFLACLSLVGLALVGCANAPAPAANSGDALQALLDASQKTTDAGSARMTLDLTVATPDRTVHITGTAEYEMQQNDPKSLREHVTFQIPSIAPGVPSGEIEMVLDQGDQGPVIYFQAPMITTFLGASTPWVKLDPSELPQTDGNLGAAAGAANPAAMLALMKDSLSVRQAGSGTVDGVVATHYVATVDLMKLLSHFADLVPGSDPAQTSPALSSARDQLEKLGLLNLPADIWVDGDGYLKQLHIAVDIKDPSSSDAAATSIELTLTLSDFGSHFPITAPRPSQVTDITDLIPSGATSTTSVG